MSGAAPWPQWIRHSATAGGGHAPAARGAWRDRLLQVGGLLLVAALAVAAEWVQNAPSYLPSVWLATGAATALAMRWPSWSMRLALVLALLAALPASQMLQAPGLHTHSIGLGLAEGVVATLQAVVTAQAMQRLWAMLHADHHRLHQVRLVHLFHMVFLVTLPRALLAGALMSALHGWNPMVLQDEGVVPWRLCLLYASASALSVLVLLPMLWLGRVGVGPRGTALALTILCAGVIVASLDNGMGLYATPLLAMAAGYLGGIGLASLCCTVMVASLMIGICYHEMPPFEGPDGFIVQLLFVYRLTATAYLASVWSDRRVRRGAGQSAGRGATVHLDLPGLAAVSTVAAARQADAPAVLLVVRWQVEDPAQTAGPRIAARNSQASSADALTLAGMLRQGDSMAHAGAEGLLVVLDDLRPEDRLGVVARVTAGVLAMRPRATVSDFAMSRRALSLCLVSAVAFEAEGSGPGSPTAVQSAASAQPEQLAAVEPAHHGA